jgi:SpoVK/Ycf46/Vps4 family AAA+-type ATPase
VIDDFGRQRVDPSDLINRWIVPLENGVDFLTLATGKKIEVPFRQLLIFATNLPVEKIVDAAFLRRIGYRLRVDPPTEEMYRRIFERCAWDRHIPMDPEALDGLIARYRREGRPLRGSEPRDLLERVLDIQRYAGLQDRPLRELLDLAWTNYFGQTPAGDKDDPLPRINV